MYDEQVIRDEDIAEKVLLYKNACVAYTKGEPVMSDEDFDLLERELKDHEITHITHDEHAGATLDSETFSIKPMRTITECNDWILQFPNQDFFASLKLDGVLAKVSTGLNFNAESRGRDGNEPWDYTVALSHVLPKIDSQLFIRGEVFLPEDDLQYFRDKYNADKYKVSRSAAISILRRPQDHTIEDIQKLKFMAYHLEGNFNKRSDMNAELLRLGFAVPDYVITRFDNMELDLNNLINRMASNTSHPSDGVVVELDDRTIIPEVIGSGKYLSTQMAIKVGRWGMSLFEGIVTGVKPTPGKGHYGMVVTIEPVVMSDGITQRNINVFNIGVIFRSQIGKGTKILFERQSNGMCYYKGLSKNQ